MAVRRAREDTPLPVAYALRAVCRRAVLNDWQTRRTLRGSAQEQRIYRVRLLVEHERGRTQTTVHCFAVLLPIFCKRLHERLRQDTAEETAKKTQTVVQHC